MTSEFPHRYGAEDRLGAVNEIGEAQVRDAGALIRSGRRYGLAQTLDAASPARMWRYWRHALILDRVLPGRFRGPNGVASLEESLYIPLKKENIINRRDTGERFNVLEVRGDLAVRARSIVELRAAGVEGRERGWRERSDQVVDVAGLRHGPKPPHPVFCSQRLLE